MKLCIVIPALDEEATIVEVLQNIPQKIDGISEITSIVIDDGSRDRTAELAREAGAKVITFPENRGVGAAFHAGVEWAIEAGSDFLVNMDGDGQFDPGDIPDLLAPLLSGEAEVVTASRFIKRELRPEMSWIKLYGNLLMSRLISTLSGNKFYDVSCGFRAYTRDTLLRLNLFGAFTYTQETILDLSFKGIIVKEVPIKVRGTRLHGKSRVASNLFVYAVNTSKIIFSSFCDYKPLRVFGCLAGIMLLVATILAVFLLTHYVRTGAFSPHVWAGMTAGFLAGMGMLIFITGLLADMLARIRMNQERVLYFLRKRRH